MTPALVPSRVYGTVAIFIPLFEFRKAIGDSVEMPKPSQYAPSACLPG